MASITVVSYWLIYLNLLRLNMWARIYPTGKVWSNYIRVDAGSWWISGQYKDTAILRGRKRRYGELTLFASVYFTGYFSNGSRFNRSGGEYAHRCTTSINNCTSWNICTISSSQYHYGEIPGYYWLHHYPGSGFGGRWIWHPRVSSLSEICRY